MLKKTLESPLDFRRSNQSTLKEISPEYSLEGLTLKLKLPDAKNWLIEKDPDAGKDWRQEEKGTIEDEMVGWYHWLDGREFEWTLGAGDEQGGLPYCNSWGRKESDTTEQLNWTDARYIKYLFTMYGCESWTVKKAERWRIDAFELWCWRRLLRVLDSKEIQPVHPKGDQSWLFIGRTDAEAETPNTLATWCEELCHLKRPWCWERLKAGGEGDNRGWDVWMASPTRWMWVLVNSGSWWWTGRPGMLQSIGSQRVGQD